MTEPTTSRHNLMRFDHVSTDSDYANLVHDDDHRNMAVWQFH